MLVLLSTRVLRKTRKITKDQEGKPSRQELYEVPILAGGPRLAATSFDVYAGFRHHD
jgi:hypothetical protein